MYIRYWLDRIWYHYHELKYSDFTLAIGVKDRRYQKCALVKDLMRKPKFGFNFPVIWIRSIDMCCISQAGYGKHSEAS